MASKFVRYKENDIILQENEPHREMYKIIHGHVELYAGYGTPLETVIGILRRGSCFGEFGLLLQRPALYTAIAYDEVTLLKITEEDLGDFIRDNHKNIIDIMRNMAGSMVTMRLQIDLLLQELQQGKSTSDENALQERIREARQIMRAYAVTGVFRNQASDGQSDP